MRVLIDARWIFEEISGIGAYTRELVTQLARGEPTDEYVLLFEREDLLRRTVLETGTDAAPHVRTLRVDYGLFSPASQLRLPGLLRREGIDVYHSPNYAIPLAAFPRHRRGPTACVITLHDVIPLKFPDFAPRSRKRRTLPLFRLLMREIGRRADIIVADSESSRRDVIDELAIDPARHPRVRRVYCGVAARYLEPAGPAARPPDAPRQILYVGRADPYKNLQGLVRAFAGALPALPPCELVIAGSPDARYPEAPALARELGIEDRVRWTGYLSEAALLGAYRDADLLVLPSRYEGFGLPVVEAMASGTPVICSPCGSLPEIAGDAALLVDPDDIAGLSKAIVRVLDDPALANDLIRRGHEQARRFRWETTAEQMRQVYREAAALPGGRGAWGAGDARRRRVKLQGPSGSAT